MNNKTWVVLVVLLVALEGSWVAFGSDEGSGSPGGDGLPGYTRRFPSMMLSNWKDMMLAWSGPRDNPNELPVRATGVTQLRLADDWSVSGVSNDSFMLSITTSNGGSAMLNNSMLWDGDVEMFASSGEFRTMMETYDNVTLPFGLTLYKSFYFPPGESFYLVQYHFESTFANESLQVTLFDYLLTQPTNCSSFVNGFFNKSNEVFTANSTQCNLFCVASGSLNATSMFSVGSGNGSDSAVYQFASTGQLNGQTSYNNAQLSFGSIVDITLNGVDSADVFFFRTLQKTFDDAIAVAERAKSFSSSYWLQYVEAAYTKFLSQGVQPTFYTAEQKMLYQNSIVLLKNSQNPTLGTFVASFHPAYLFKTWGRDGAFAAMIMDAAGYRSEAENYLIWMSSAEPLSNYAFHTCYSLFTGEVVGFVEPQYDSAGAYLMAIYHHYQLLLQDGNTTHADYFANLVLNRVRQVESFFLDNLGYNNLVPADYSIWEESSNGRTGQPLPTAYFTFTQSVGYGGLISAALLEYALGNDPTTLYNRANQLQEAIESNLWISEGYYARSIWSDTLEIDSRRDGSTVAAVWAGVANASRSFEHITQIQQNLTQQEYGIGRYWNDPFFYDSIYNPGGEEVGAPTPPWGVVTMMMSWAELTIGGPALLQNVANRLDWMNKHAAPGQMPVGEAIDGVTGLFVMSSCPDLYEYGGVYVWTVLMNQTLSKLPNPTLWN